MNDAKIRNSHKALIQGVYQWQSNPKPIALILSELKKNKFFNFDAIYLEKNLDKMVDNKDQIDSLIINALDRPIERISSIEQALLRVGCHLLIEHHEAKHPLIISEMLTLTCYFAEKTQAKYINAVLDQISKQQRA
jgi:transcription antitermination factor NusB